MLKDKSKDTQQHMTEFGRVLYSLMLTRGIEFKQDLFKILNEGGYTISQARLSYYFNGERTVDPVFLGCVTELLGLNKKERDRLRDAYSYGQIRPDSKGAAIVEAFKDAN